MGLLRLAALLATGPLLAGCSSKRLTGAPETTVVPAAAAALAGEFDGDTFFAEVYLDGRGPYAFLLDTGAVVSIVDDRLAAAHPDRVTAQRAFLGGAHGGRVAFDEVVRGAELVCGPARFEGFVAVVTDTDALARELGRDVDGILGLPVFGDCLLTVDYPGREVRVAAGELPKPDGREVLELRRGEVDHLVTGRVAGRLAPFRLDTGSGFAVDVPVWMADLPFHEETLASTTAWTTTGRRPVNEVGVLDGSVRLGAHVLEEPLVARSRLGYGLVGTRVLRDFELTFDLARRRVRLRRTPPP